MSWKYSPSPRYPETLLVIPATWDGTSVSSCFLSYSFPWWESCLGKLSRSASPGFCCLHSHSLHTGILSGVLIPNLQPLCRPEIKKLTPSCFPPVPVVVAYLRGTVFEMFQLHSLSPGNWSSSVRCSGDVLIRVKYSSGLWSTEITFGFPVGTLNVQIYFSQSFVML